ncbi:MAG: prolyl oligopeptidase family serine peptidase [Pseudomonadota bacterium]
MRRVRLFCVARVVAPLLFALPAGVLAATAVLHGPPARALTDPKSIVSPAGSGPAARPLADFFKSAASWTAVLSGDGRSLIYSSDESGRLNLWRAPLEGAGAAVQITHAEDRQFVTAATRDGRWVLFQSDVGGREMYDLYAVSPAGGKPVNLTQTPGASDTAAVVAADNRTVAFSSRLEKAPATNLAVLDLVTHKARVLTQEKDPTRMWSAVAFSSDSKTLIANNQDVTRSQGEIYRVDLATGKTSKVLVQGAKGKVSAADLSPDGKWLAANVETAAGESNAALVELASGKMRWLKPDPWEQAAVRFSPDGQDVLVRSNVDGRDVVYLAAIAGGEAREVPLPPGLSSDWFGLLPAFTPDGARLVFPHESGSEPLEYWVQDLKSGPGRPITRLSSLETKTLPRTRIVHYPSADGTIISAVLWIPNGVARNGHARGVVYPHGGPTGQTRDGFDRTPLALADRGFFVIAPNPRGSTGYGRAFMEANKRDLGGGDLEDEVAAAKFLTDTGYVDAHRIGITGGSYGGYMTLMAIGKTPEVWSAAVDEYGIVNWVSMYAHGSPQLRLYQAALIGTPERDKDVYTKTSPLTYLGNAKAPLLVLQGDTDIRVPREESEQIVAFLKAHGRTVEGHYYAEEGHGFMKRENQIDAMQRTIAWFERYLGGL